jgi:hypothetical protein
MKKKDTIKWKTNMKMPFTDKTSAEQFYGYNFTEKVEKLQRELNSEMDRALYGKPHKDTRTNWQKRIDALKEIINDIRVRIAEWIGGDALHDNCDY